MGLTPGQRIALEQLRAIESEGSALEITRITEPSDSTTTLIIEVSIDCASFSRAEGGLPLRARERFRIFVSSGFPFDYPFVETRHKRFAGFPHVQWCKHLCLYQAPTTEWDPSDGMFGFIERLRFWLVKGAVGELDTTGEPLHPPVAYRTSGPYRLVVPKVNAPQFEEQVWLGFSALTPHGEHRVDLVEWLPLAVSDSHKCVAAAILLSDPMPFEYPAKIADLLSALEARGARRSRLFLMMQAALLCNPEGEALYVIVGAPMRGIKGGPRRQHLTAWLLEPVMVKALRLAIDKYSADENTSAFGTQIEELFWEWAITTDANWCEVKDDRPEIITRRDAQSPVHWFAGRTISLWGCGALGGHVAEFLVRAGVKKLVLRDRGSVGPGLLQRQPFDDADIGRAKVSALRDRLLRIRPEVELVAHVSNLLHSPLDDADWTDGTELLIDTTASEAVLTKLELRRRSPSSVRVPIVSMAIGHEALNGLVVVAPPEFSGGPQDVIRRAKLEACSRPRLSHFADEFWPRERRPVFQPEPGCSDATFVGSAADVAALAGLMLNTAAGALKDSEGRRAFAAFLAQPAPESALRPLFESLWFDADHICPDPQSNYEVRVSHAAMAEMLAWANRSRRVSGVKAETGGLSFGERDDAIRVVWVTEVSGPPPDSTASQSEFVCGVSGTQELNDEKRIRTRGAVTFVGMWHTHPQQSPLPSATDCQGMGRLLRASDRPPAKALLTIIGRPCESPTVGTYVFSKSDFADLDDGRRTWRTCAVSTITTRPQARVRRDVALALSGGGARAMAFHLGCLRALHDRNLLSQVAVMSAVSGGSVIAAMYAYSQDPFDEFDKRVTHVLRRGLQGDIARRALLSPHLLGALGTTVVAGTAATATSAAQMSAQVVTRLLKADGAARRLSRTLRPPFRRWMSRTTAFERALRDTLFGETKVGDPRRDGVEVVFNACELRTGTAFRFGSRESCCWRFGHVVGNDVSLAQAVSTSAAYPAILPALDRVFTFEDGDGNRRAGRVILTDGGVYDNLGVSCLLAGRPSRFGCNDFSPQYIVCCDAGPGQLSDHTHPYWWPSRMSRSFESTFRKNLDGARARLHHLQEAGALKGFVLAYLGQQDSALPLVPVDLVRREAVVDYPTDFAPMRPADIERLALRGEQLTRMLIARYVPEL